MSYEFEVKDIEPRTVATISAKTTPAEIGSAFMEILPAVWKFVTDAGAQPAGVPFARYLSFSEETVDLEAGVPLSEPISDGDRVKVHEIPGGKAVVTWHHGPYEKLPEAYEAFDQWSKESEFSPSKPPMEIYWTGPEEGPDSSKWRTELIFPL